VIDERGHALAINHVFAIGQSEQIGPGMVVVELVGFLDGNARPSVLHDDRAFLDDSRRMATLGIYLRVANDQVCGAVVFSSVVAIELARCQSGHGFQSG